MSTRIFKNATIFEGENLEERKGYLKIQNGEIKEIEDGKPPKEGTDLRNSFVLPPLINAHTHLGDSIAKSIYSEKNQKDVVGKHGEKFSALKNSSDYEKIESMKKEIEKMKRAGILTHIDFRENGLEGVKLLEKAKDKSVNSIILGRPKIKEDYTTLIERTDGIGIPSLNSYSEERIAKISKIVNEKRKLLSFHVSETEKAREKSLKKYGKSEIEKSLEYNPSFLVHGTHASKEDLDLLAERKEPLVMCPRANCLLNDGMPPIKKALDSGVKLFLGTDNVSINPPNLFRELSFTWSILRERSSRVGSKEAKELLKSVTTNPIKTINSPFEPIKEGNKASFIILSRNNNLKKIRDPYVGIVNRATEENVTGMVL